MFYSLLFSPCFLISFVFSDSPFNSTNGDVTECLKRFYKAVYSGEYNCTLPFLERNVTRFFTPEKACFLEVAKEECSVAQYNLLSTKYDEFSSIISEKPSDTDCSHPFYKYNALQCEPLIDDLESKFWAARNLQTKINDTRVLSMIGLCNRTLTCAQEDPCYFPEPEVENWIQMCTEIELKNTEFTACLNKIRRLLPDLSEYDCLDGRNFDELKYQIEMMTLKKDCTEEIMKGFCGDKAVSNFDSDVEQNLDSLKFTARVVNILEKQEFKN